MDRVIAANIVAEIGTDMSAFVNAAHLASWATMCPGNHERAGKQRRGKIRNTYRANQYHRLNSRHGVLRAAVAIGHKIPLAACHMLATATDYNDLGADDLDHLNAHRIVGNMLRHLRRLGYDVQIAKAA